MTYGLKFAGAIALATVLAIPAASAKSMGGGHGGHIGGGHIGAGHGGGGVPFVAPKFHGGVKAHGPGNVHGPVVKNWGGGNWQSGEQHHHHGHNHHRRFFAYSVPLYDYSDYGNSDCRWLWHKWLNTGNPKWKYRYYECIE